MSEWDEHWPTFKQARSQIRAEWPGCLILREFKTMKDWWEYTVLISENYRTYRLDVAAPNLAVTDAAIDVDALMVELKKAYAAELSRSTIFKV